MSSEINSFKCIDFHTHIYPEINLRSHVPQTYLQKIKTASKYYSAISHAVQQKIHFIPENVRKKFDPLLLSFTVPTLAINSNASDLAIEMETHSVDYAVVASHPPLITNEFIIKQTKNHPNMLPCLTYTETDQQFFKIEDLSVENAAPQFLLKLNPMAQNFDLNTPELRNLLDHWDKKSFPMLIHTGALYSSFFKNPTAGSIENLAELISEYKNIHFILLHMNIFKPYEALEFCQKFKNTAVTTSWQSEDLIAIACKKIGSERILFSSDWPLIGNNIEVRKNMIFELNQKGHLTNSETENILYKNARNILENYFSKKL